MRFLHFCTVNRDLLPFCKLQTPRIHFPLPAQKKIKNKILYTSSSSLRAAHVDVNNAIGVAFVDALQLLPPNPSVLAASLRLNNVSSHESARLENNYKLHLRVVRSNAGENLIYARAVFGGYYSALHIGPLGRPHVAELAGSDVSIKVGVLRKDCSPASLLEPLCASRRR